MSNHIYPSFVEKAEIKDNGDMVLHLDMTKDDAVPVSVDRAFLFNIRTGEVEHIKFEKRKMFDINTPVKYL